MSTLDYILNKYFPNRKYQPDFEEFRRMPIKIRDTNRETLTHLFRELGFTLGVEIGVRGGEFSEMICRNNPDLGVMYGIDPYEPHEGYKDIQRQSTFNKYEKEAHTRLDKYAKYDFIKHYSKDSLHYFDDTSLDFVYIDGDHSFYEVTHDIEFWSKKVRPGGIVSGDDYFKHRGESHIDVYQVVNAYTDAKGIKPWFVLGADDVIEGEKRDHGRSWFWVK